MTLLGPAARLRREDLQRRNVGSPCQLLHQPVVARRGCSAWRVEESGEELRMMGELGGWKEAELAEATNRRSWSCGLRKQGCKETNSLSWRQPNLSPLHLNFFLSQMRSHSTSFEFVAWHQKRSIHADSSLTLSSTSF